MLPALCEHLPLSTAYTSPLDGIEISNAAVLGPSRSSPPGPSHAFTPFWPSLGINGVHLVLTNNWAGPSTLKLSSSPPQRQETRASAVMAPVGCRQNTRVPPKSTPAAILLPSSDSGCPPLSVKDADCEANPSPRRAQIPWRKEDPWCCCQSYAQRELQPSHFMVVPIMNDGKTTFQSSCLSVQPAKQEQRKYPSWVSWSCHANFPLSG